jgi:ribose 5-phosphate isomerase A
MNLNDQIKKNVAEKALDFIQNNMIVGIGSGTTVQAFIHALKIKVDKGLVIKTIAASKESEDLLRSFKIPVDSSLTSCDIYIDGADEIDDEKNCLKGLGRALFREKIIAFMSKQVIICVDESKRSLKLHKAPIVCEILPFGFAATIKQIEKLGFKGKLRHDAKNQLLVTDNGNYLFDITLDGVIEDPKKTHQALKHIPGVLETGLFFNIVNKVLIGLKEGQVIEY